MSRIVIGKEGLHVKVRDSNGVCRQGQLKMQLMEDS